MKRDLLLIVLVFSLVLFFPRLGFTRVNEYSLVPVDLEVGPGDSTVEVDIHINIVDTIGAFLVTLFAEGTSNPVLDTILTGGLADLDPPAFASPPSLLVLFPTKLVNPYGPPSDPLIFFAHAFVSHLPPSNELFCRMFYKVSGPGTLTFRTAVHSTAGATGMNTYYGPVPINWPPSGEVGNFNVTGPLNEFSLDPVDLRIFPCDSTIQVNVNIKTVYPNVEGITLPLIAGGISNPVLDTILTGGLANANPPAFYAPSLADHFIIRIVNPYGPPDVPMLFTVFTTDGGVVNPTEGLFCRMFFKVSGPGTLTFRTAVHPTGGPVRMGNYTGNLPVNWPDSEEVGSFDVYLQDFLHGNANCDEQINVSDVIYIIAYLFKGGESPNPFDAGDANCDGQVTVSDVIYLINYLFKSGPPPPC